MVGLILFSIPESFPSKTELVHFGYLTDNRFKLNLVPSAHKEKNASILLSSVLRKTGSNTVKPKKSNDKDTTSKRQKRSLSKNLIE